MFLLVTFLWYCVLVLPPNTNKTRKQVFHARKGPLKIPWLTALQRNSLWQIEDIQPVNLENYALLRMLPILVGRQF